MTVDEAMRTLHALSMIGWGSKDLCMWPADISDMQLVETIEYDDLHDRVVAY
jgi:hypothetical protein